jgi:phosphoglycolate phosphatase
MRCVVFDLDGTLADTSGDLVAAANAALGQAGVTARLDAAADAAVALTGGKAMLRLGLARAGQGGDEARVSALYPVLLRAYADALAVHTRLYPGAAEAVETLRAAGFATAICTNKPAALAEALMVSLGVRALFGALVGADTLPVRKPDPAPYRLAVTQAGGAVGRSLMVGDTETDRETARAAGVPAVLVTFGPAGGDMAALSPEALLADFADLPTLAARMLA